ncbi:MAG: hypothetical protein GXO82_01940, partial [Chlorobi bacterium]|nr:hypothetical protein [Chlorobiota bacterium]
MNWPVVVFIASLFPALLVPLTLGFFIRKNRRDCQADFEPVPVSVVVAAHNEQDHLPSLLAALEQQDYPSH